MAIRDWHASWRKAERESLVGRPPVQHRLESADGSAYCSAVDVWD